MIIVVLCILLVFVYWVGPRPARPVLDVRLPEVTPDLAQLAREIAETERAVPGLKADNQARIIWATERPVKTAYSLVYLPGFTASFAEGEPLHREFARRYGCNLYLPRLHAHGLIDVNAYATLTADELIVSAAHALAVGRQLGEQVILLSMSTGSTLSLILAANFPDLVAGLITFSPNIRLRPGAARLLSRPWGLQLARLATGSRYRSYEGTEEYKKYWYTYYRLEGLVALQSLLTHSMRPGLFARVRQPFFMGYYFKNETEQDQIVSVPAMLKMYEQLGTPPHLKRKVAFPAVGRHAMISYLTSSDLESVRRETFRFAEEVLGLEVEW